MPFPVYISCTYNNTTILHCVQKHIDFDWKLTFTFSCVCVVALLHSIVSNCRKSVILVMQMRYATLYPHNNYLLPPMHYSQLFYSGTQLNSKNSYYVFWTEALPMKILFSELDGDIMYTFMSCVAHINTTKEQDLMQGWIMWILKYVESSSTLYTQTPS